MTMKATNRVLDIMAMTTMFILLCTACAPNKSPVCDPLTNVCCDPVTNVCCSKVNNTCK